MKKDTEGNWTQNNPVLLNGEIILVDTDSGELRAKVGDGTKTYTQLPFTDEILKNLITGKQNKLAGASGQIVGFGEDGSAQPEDFPGLTQAQGDERYLPQTGGTVTGQLRLAMNENSGSLYFGESSDGSDGMIVSQDGRMVLSTGSGANRAAVTVNKSSGSIIMQTRNGTSGSDAGTLNFSPSGLNMGAKPITNCPTLDGKQDKLTGAQGQVVGFDAEGNAVAQAAPQTGMTQGQADQRYLQKTGGTIQGDLQVTGMGQIGGVGLGTMDGNDEFGSSITLAGVVNSTPNRPIGFGVLDDSGNIGAGLLIAHVEESSEPDSFIFLTKKGEGASDVKLPYLTPLSTYSAATKSYVDNKVAAMNLSLAFGPQTVASSAWAANTTYSAQGYGYRASVPLSGVTADHIPDVTFAMADAVSGNLAPLADTYAGGIYIYAKEQPSATVNIASVVCTKGV